MVHDLLKKAKKLELVRFTKEVLGEKISMSGKKKVFLKTVFKRLINLKKSSIVGIVNVTSECVRNIPRYIDTVLGKE